MNKSEMLRSVLRIQAHTKLFLCYEDEGNHTFAIASLKIIQQEVLKIQDNCISGDGQHIYFAK